MDTLTHGLLGALTIRALPKRDSEISLGEVTLLGLFAAMFPDVDYLLLWVNPLQFLSDWHRGATHSFVMLPLWALALGLLAALAVRAPWKWPRYSQVCAIALASHIVADLLTPFGTQIFNPLSDYRAVIGTTFIIDVYFSVIVVAGLLASHLARRRPYQRPLALAAVALLVAYIGTQAYFRSLALGLGREHAAHAGLEPNALHTLPQPFSPTYWHVILETDQHFEAAYLDVAPVPWQRGFTRLLTAVITGNNHTALAAVDRYLPATDTGWRRYPKISTSEPLVLAAWQRDEFSRFRKFARYPVLYRVDRDSEGSCVWFTDLRYVLPAMLPPFRYGMCQQREHWRPYRLKRNTRNARQEL